MMNPRVTAVEVIDFHRFLVIFKNEEHSFFDMAPYLDLPVFQHLRDAPDFYNVRAEHGTVTWANEIDLCPDTIYLESTPYNTIQYINK
jgi:hypothetical protein